MPITITITADTPAELRDWLADLGPSEMPTWVEASPAEPRTLREELAAEERVAAVVETIKEVAQAEPAKRGRGRPLKKVDEFAGGTDPQRTIEAEKEPETMTAAQAEHHAQTSQTGTELTLDACKAALRELTDRSSYDDGRALLAKFNIQRVGLIDPKLYGDFIKAAKEWVPIAEREAA